MPKLYFRHGAVSSAKTLELLSVAHTYRTQGKNCVVMKPEIDTRFGRDTVRSRAGLSQTADVVITPGSDLSQLVIPDVVHCVVVDEAQFLSADHIEQLRDLTISWNVPVICYGLRTDFRTKLFPGSKRLMELADSIEEIKTTCISCNAKAIFNLKHSNGVGRFDGPVVEMGDADVYKPVCYTCYRGAAHDLSF